MGRKYTKDVLAPAVAGSRSIAGVVRYLGLHSKSGAVWSSLKRYILEYGLDTGHFSGLAHAKGVSSPRRRTPQEILVVRDQAYRQTAVRLRRALLAIGVAHECAICGLPPQWQGQELVLEVDHVNGDWNDCRQENLRFLCPNCHAQTDTYKNSKRCMRG